MADSFWKTVLRGHTAQGSQQLNVFYHKADDTDARIITTLGNWAEDMADLLTPAMDEDAGFDGADIYKRVGSEWVYQSTDPMTKVGEIEATAAPPQNALVIRGVTFTGKIRPMKFFGGLSTEAFGDAGLLSSTLFALAADVMAFWVSFYGAGPSALSPGTWSKSIGLFVPLIGGVIDYIIGSQRRRKAGIGA